MKNRAMTAAEMATKYVNKKVMLGGMALLFGVLMIVLFTFVPYSWEPERLTSDEFIMDSLIIVAITLLGMVCLIFMSQATNANNPASKIAVAMANFKVSKAKIADKHAFKQWIREVQQPKDLQDIKERILMHVGIDDATVLDLSEPEIKGLLDEAKMYRDVPYPALNREQIRACLSIKRGVRVKFPVPEVYLSARAVLDDRTRSERLANEGSKKRNYALLSIISKVVMTLLISVIFTMFVRDLTQEADVATAAGKFATRMMNLFTSSFMGFLVGGQLNDLDAEYVDLRTETFEEFLADTGFKPKSVKEEALEQIEKTALDAGCQTDAPTL